MGGRKGILFGIGRNNYVQRNKPRLDQEPSDYRSCGGDRGACRRNAVGGPIQENKDKVQRANPITYVTKNDPPFLIVHGDKDPLVPHNQSEILLDALKKAGVEATLYTVPGGGHGGFKDPQVEVLVAQFFNKHLRK